MATVIAIKAKTQTKTAMGKVIAYVVQKKKTLFNDTESGQKYRLISGQNCVAETAFNEFMATKIQYGKDNGVFYKQFVQSFKPDEAATPKEIHQMGLELAEYFKGFEILVATHIDANHWHNHLIVNSVNAETGLKIQFNEKNLNELRQRSDEICQAHGLKTLKPYQKDTPVAGMNTREYRTAVKGNSWKFKLINAIDMAMKASKNKDDFIANMEQMGYSVKWIDHYKYITYTTPEGQKCRDNRLHDEKYLKERMEQFYEFRQIESLEQAGQTIGTAGKFVRGVQPENSVLRNPAGSVGNIGFDVDRNRKVPSAHAGQNQRLADMGGLEKRNSAGGSQRIEPSSNSDKRLRENITEGLSADDGQFGNESSGFIERQAERVGAVASSAGQYADQAKMEVDGDWSSVAGAVIGAAVALENLLVSPQDEQEEKKYVPKLERGHKHKSKNKITHDRDKEWEMEM